MGSATRSLHVLPLPHADDGHRAPGPRIAPSNRQRRHHLPEALPRLSRPGPPGDGW